MIWRALIVLAALWALPAAAQVKVVGVAYPLAWLAAKLGGEGVEVTYPVPADQDAEFWRPGIADITAIQSADLILLNGAGFAGWTERVSLPRRAVVQTTRGLEEAFIAIEAVTHSHGGETHSHEAIATFTWMDPGLLAKQGEVIAQALERRGVSVDRAVLAALTALGEEIEALPPVTLATSHPRYQYLAARPGFTLLELETDAGAAFTADEIAQVQAASVSALLLEQAPATLPAVDVPTLVWPTFGRAAGDEDVLAAWRGAFEALSAALSAAEPS